MNIKISGGHDSLGSDTYGSLYDVMDIAKSDFLMFYILVSHSCWWVIKKLKN